VTAYDAAEWTDLFVATAGASAALAGLVFVAVSINIERILQFEGLPERALETVLLLLGVLLASIIALAPGLSREALGALLLGEALVVGALIWRLPWRTGTQGVEPHLWALSRLGVRAAGTVPFVVGGISILADGGGGLYWILAGVLGAFVGAVANAWVLLVEILR